MGPSRGQPCIAFSDVGLRYGREAEVLRNVSFEIEQASFVFVRGASGAGKSSLLRLMYMAMPQTRGKILLFGKDTVALDREQRTWIRRRIGIVFQELYLLEHVTATMNVAIPLMAQGRSRKQAVGLAHRMLRHLALGDRRDTVASKLSGGERQRLAMARAVAPRPLLLLADEPTASLDEEHSLFLLRLLNQMRDGGTTVIFATHSGDLVARTSHPVLTLEAGRLVSFDGRVRR